MAQNPSGNSPCLVFISRQAPIRGKACAQGDDSKYQNQDLQRGTNLAPARVPVQPAPVVRVCHLRGGEWVNPYMVMTCSLVHANETGNCSVVDVPGALTGVPGHKCTAWRILAVFEVIFSSSTIYLLEEAAGSVHASRHEANQPIAEA